MRHAAVSSWPLVFALACSVAPAAGGCGKMELQGLVHPNLPPTVELTQVPAPGNTDGTYVYELSWAGFDADGRVDRFYYAVDPPTRANAETVWVRTTRNRETFTFRADSVGSGADTHARGFHTVAVHCVDDRGARSPVVHASFTSTTVAPTVTIRSPQPSTLLGRQVAPSVRISWTGEDPDGVGTTQPVSYRWKLFGESGELSFIAILSNPDTLRQRYAPAFAGWDSVPGSTNSATLHDLVTGKRYLFVVVAIDRAGAYSPVFSASSNILWLQASAASGLGPIITIGSSNFSYTYPYGGVSLDPDFFVRVDFAADRPIQLEWTAKPASGGFIRSYRWAVDIARIDDETPRSDEATDFAHWSRGSTATNVTLPPFSPAGGLNSETHFFYLEVEEDVGLLSLAVVEFTVVRASFDRQLLIVDDTWFSPDRAGVGGCVTAPGGNWPSAAELDTFLYAVGGKPYRCYPAGTTSPTGLFAGYSFDTLGTHTAPVSQLSLQQLDRYRHIIWMADLTSAFTYDQDPFTSIRPMPVLRALSAPGAANPLVTWLQQGGRLWLAGGGSALASLRPWDARNSPTNEFSVELGELVPGRLMHDWAHWRSRVRVLRTTRVSRSPRALGGWPGAPDYSKLPPELLEKSPDTDPLPPLRTSNFYLAQCAAEHLALPNIVTEADETDPSGETRRSVLDTLYVTNGGEAGFGWPVMTLSHQSGREPFVFSGFPPWYFRRAQAIQLVDFVLQDVWGLERKPVPRAAAP